MILAIFWILWGIGLTIYYGLELDHAATLGDPINPIHLVGAISGVIWLVAGGIILAVKSGGIRDD